MKGTYDIRIENARMQFKFTLRRNLTLIKGPSATGKTTLVGLVSEYEREGQASGITLSSPKACCVLSEDGWAEKLKRTSDSFVFVDEGSGFVHTQDFAHEAKNSDNYYVIVSREDLPMLPYSVEEVYGLKNTTSRYPGVRKFYTHTKRIYSETLDVEDPHIVIVEDSNAGFDFFKALCAKTGAECISAHGKGNILSLLRDCGEKRVLIIADGAAFGPHMEAVRALARRKGAGLFLPESFEWLILKSGLVKSGHVNEILEDPAAFIESSEFFSWERFFNAVLVQETRDSYLKYSKRKLNPAFLKPYEMGKVADVLPVLGME